MFANHFWVQKGSPEAQLKSTTGRRRPTKLVLAFGFVFFSRLLIDMLPVEPRLKPLGATILHYPDGADTKVEFKRCHSFPGYIPYALSDADAKSDCSLTSGFDKFQPNFLCNFFEIRKPEGRGLKSPGKSHRDRIE